MDLNVDPSEDVGRRDPRDIEATENVEWLTRYCSHVIGSTLFLLPYAMAHTGVGVFIAILVTEAYLSRNSLLHFVEMVESQPGPSTSERTNYFVIVGQYLPTWLRYFPHIVFSMDVVLLVSFYYKVVCLLYEYFIFENGAPENVRAGYHNQAFFAVVSFVIIYELWERLRGATSTTSVVDQSTIVKVDHSAVEKLNVRPVAGDSSSSRKKLAEMTAKINMDAVSKEMNHYAKRRPILLLLCMLGACQQLSIFFNTWRSEKLLATDNLTDLCPGLNNSIMISIFNTKTALAFPIIKFVFMNYTIMLPVCTAELELPRNEYRRIKDKAHVILTLIFTAFALMVYCTLGDSVPPLFMTAYGRNVYGQMIVGLALAMTVMAMLLRFMACFKLVQVLFSNSDTESMYLVIVGTFFGVAFIVTQLTRNLMQIAIFSGSLTSNLLFVIIPRMAYISFIRKKFMDQATNPRPRTSTQESRATQRLPILRLNLAQFWKLTQIFMVIVFHLFMLLIGTTYAFYDETPDTNQGCRQVFTEFWRE